MPDAVLMLRPGAERGRDVVSLIQRRAAGCALALGVLIGSTACTGSPSEKAEPAPPATTGVGTTAGDLFWTQHTRGQPRDADTIGRVSVDGSGAKANFIKGATAPSGVAVHGGHIYWINRARDAIGRARLDSSQIDQDFIEDIGAFASGIAVDDRHIYWTNAGNGYSAPLGLIGRARLDGSGADPRFIKAGDTPTGLAADDNHLYWAHRWLTDPYHVGGYAIGRAQLDGSEVEQRFVDLSNEVHGVAVNDRYLYWTNSAENAIGRAAIDGTAVNQRCFAPQGLALGNVPEGLAVDAQHVFWTNRFANTIARANLDGSGLDEHFLPTNGVPAELAVSSQPASQPQQASSTECVGAREPVLLGTKGVNVDYWADGWGEVAPRYFTNASTAGGTIDHVRWSSLGGAVAEGRALSPLYRPHGGFYREPGEVQLRATKLTRCESGGPLAYSQLTVRRPNKPGGPLGEPHRWAQDMCDPYP